jgi:hypothetical protein
MRNSSAWRGSVGMVLGGRLYVDMSGDFSDSNYFASCVNTLYDRIISLIRVPHSETLSSPRPQSLRSTVSTRKSNDVKQLCDLSVAEVQRLLEGLQFGTYKHCFFVNEVDGLCLDSCSSVQDVKELGITITVKAKVLFEKISTFKIQGVPTELISGGLAEKKGSSDLSTKHAFFGDADENYEDSISEEEEEPAAPKYEEIWTCHKCLRENYEESPYCIYCATYRNKGRISLGTK